MSLLDVRAIEVEVAGRSLCAQLNLAIEAGECWGLLGRNGAGKTSLVHTLAGLRRPRAGTILFDRRPLQAYTRRQLAQRVGVLLQDAGGGALGTVLGAAQVNIATFNLGRSAPGENAIALLGVDEQISDAVLDSIKALPHVRHANRLHF